MCTDDECFWDILPLLVHSDNTIPHGGTGLTPNKIDESNKEKVWFRIYYHRSSPGWRASKLYVSNNMQVSNAMPNWTQKVFSVHCVHQDVSPVIYYIEHLKGKDIWGVFDKQLQNAHKLETFCEPSK